MAEVDYTAQRLDDVCSPHPRPTLRVVILFLCHDNSGVLVNKSMIMLLAGLTITNKPDLLRSWRLPAVLGHPATGSVSQAFNGRQI